MNKFVFDTNTLVENPDLLKEYNFDQEEIVVPMIVLEEIDKLKNNSDMLGFNARELIRKLEEYGEKIKYIRHKVSKIKCNDDIILEIAKASNAILVTNDKILKLKAVADEVKTEPPRVSYDINHKLYKGFKEVEVIKEVIDEFYIDNEIELEGSYLENEYIFLKGPSKQSAIGKIKNGRLIRISNDYEDYKSFTVKPRNKEQLICLDALLDPDIPVVSLVGLAGSGKTMLALAAGLKQVFAKDEARRYKRILVTRPIQVLGNDIGFLPGTLEEKMDPWIAPIYDNLDTITGGDKIKVEQWFEKGKIQIEAMAYIRGRSIPDAFIIVDECQNITPHEIKTILTRVGNNTKIILTGDVEQIDNPKLNKFSNGLTYMIERFKEFKISAHVSLTKGERSEVANVAATVL